MSKEACLKNILILDDDKDFRKLLISQLREYFRDVEFYEYDPIEKGEPTNDFDWSIFDVLILDHYLCVHGLTGLDIFQKHRAKANFPATIMLTGASNEELVMHAMKSGIQDYIKKNKLDIEILVKAINDAYEQHHILRKKQDDLHDAIAESKTEIDKLRQLKTEAEEQLQQERGALEQVTTESREQLEKLESEKRTQQEAVDKLRQLKTETEEQLQKEREALIIATREKADIKVSRKDGEQEKQKIIAENNQNIEEEDTEDDKSLVEVSEASEKIIDSDELVAPSQLDIRRNGKIEGEQEQMDTREEINIPDQLEEKHKDELTIEEYVDAIDSLDLDVHKNHKADEEQEEIINSDESEELVDPTQKFSKTDHGSES